jgi:putative endonuclease
MIAFEFLRRSGYKLLEKNYRVVLGEIDAVGEKDGRIIFFEVKTRSGTRFGAPEEAVHEAKQRKIIRLAQWYLKENKMEGRAVSFAVVSVMLAGPSRPPEIRLIENAF